MGSRSKATTATTTAGTTAHTNCVWLTGAQSSTPSPPDDDARKRAAKRPPPPKPKAKEIADKRAARRCVRLDVMFKKKMKSESVDVDNNRSRVDSDASSSSMAALSSSVAPTPTCSDEDEGDDAQDASVTNESVASSLSFVQEDTLNTWLEDKRQNCLFFAQMGKSFESFVRVFENVCKFGSRKQSNIVIRPTGLEMSHATENSVVFLSIRMGAAGFQFYVYSAIEPVLLCPVEFGTVVSALKTLSKTKSARSDDTVVQIIISKSRPSEIEFRTVGANGQSSSSIIRMVALRTETYEMNLNDDPLCRCTVDAKEFKSTIQGIPKFSQSPMCTLLIDGKDLFVHARNTTQEYKINVTVYNIVFNSTRGYRKAIRNLINSPGRRDMGYKLSDPDSWCMLNRVCETNAMVAEAVDKSLERLLYDHLRQSLEDVADGTDDVGAARSFDSIVDASESFNRAAKESLASTQTGLLAKPRPSSPESHESDDEGSTSLFIAPKPRKKRATNGKIIKPEPATQTQIDEKQPPVHASVDTPEVRPWEDDDCVFINRELAASDEWRRVPPADGALRISMAVSIEMLQPVGIHDNVSAYALVFVRTRTIQFRYDFGEDDWYIVITMSVNPTVIQ